MDKLNPISAGILLLASLTIALIIKPVSAAGCHVLSKSTLERKAGSYDSSIRSASHKYGVHENLIKAVITVESCFRTNARGTSGEKGLMQLMPGTARRFNVSSGYNPWQNVHGGTRYLSHLLKYYDGDTRRAIAAYNAGEGNVRPGGRIYNKDYVRKVLQAYSKFSGRSTQSAGDTASETKINKRNNKRKAKTRSDRSQRTLAAKRKKNSNASARRGRALPWQDKHHSADDRNRFVTVKAGDTVYQVMRRTGLSVQQLISLNGLQAPYHLKAGQRIRVQ